MATAEQQEGGNKRVMSVDALRGFDMFWIIGAEGIVHGLRQLSHAPWIETIARQMEHEPWQGFRAYDLIFPLFVFLMGVSTVFSLQRIVERDGRSAATWRVIRRGVLLYLIGLAYYGAKGDPEMFRFVGVLQRIAICYLIGGLLFLYLRLPGLIATCIGLLVLYWGVMALLPFPGAAAANGADRYAEGKNLANYVDQHYLPGYKWDGDWDPEGLLSGVPAVSTGLLGIFAGLILTQTRFTDLQRVKYLLILGGLCLVVGWGWSYSIPIIKKLWTSSFVLWAGGWSFLLLALFYWVIDVCHVRAWAQPFLWIGMNSLTIYLVDNLVSFSGLVQRVFHEPLRASLGRYEAIVMSTLSLGLAVWFCRWLYQRKIFLRL
jgi:predicted acyltransferase